MGELIYNNPLRERVVPAWYNNFTVYYLDLGETKVTKAGIKTPPIYFFIRGYDEEGRPLLVHGQYNVLSAVPVSENYTSFWQVHLVEVPFGYQPNFIRSELSLRKAGFEVTPIDLIINCPVL
ncbi:hypothetical protein Desgi_2947 [Calderihabitans maritimus]|uniref:Uncharacterized protein n=1 Tax=Calderihabitans maritimus TaxID=1246530 RepID=A0A1Z5HQC6_9FIRM|nr:hypothetical protein Desgi_2947 [Calderihabitans maritimus]